MARILFLLLIVMSSAAFAQTEETPKAVKYSEFETATNGYVKMMMDGFYVELSNNPASQGFIINYGTDREITIREKQIRVSIQWRKFDVTRITFVRGSFWKNSKTELWVVPPGAEKPQPSTNAEKFDEFGKINEEDLSARLDNLYVSLSNNPDSLGYILNFGSAKIIAASEQRIKKYIVKRKLDLSRIVLKNGGSNYSARTEFWIIQGSAIGQEGKTVKANGFKTHYLEWGKGSKTIVLIHGLSDTSEIWKDFAPRLTKNFRVIAPDRRGVGKSEKPANGYDTATLAADVEKLLDALKIERAIVVGHSFGGNTAMALAANAPLRVESLILIEGGFWEKREPVPLKDCGVPADADCLMNVEIQRGVNEYDAATLYPKIVSPTLLILGLPKELNKAKLNKVEKTSRRFFNEAAAQTRNVARNKLKNGRALIIKNAAHWAFGDQPEAVAREILKFIKTNEFKRN